MSSNDTACTALHGSGDRRAATGVPARNTVPREPAERSIRRTASSRARPYVLAVISLGFVVLGHSASVLWTSWPPAEWWMLAVLTLLSGSAVLKIPAIPVNFSISDVFTLTTAVMFGPEAATVVVAVDSLAISARLMRPGLPVERILFNAAAPPAAMWLSAHLFFLASGRAPLQVAPVGLEVIGPWLLLFAALYFLVNTFAIAVAIGLHEGAGILHIWRAHFQSLWVTFIGGAIGAACMVLPLQFGAYGRVALALPLLLAAVLHFAYRNATGRIADQLRHLAEVNRLHLSTIEALAHAIDAKDAVTHGHIRRVQSWAVELASHLGVDDARELKAIEAAALLHDIGKLAIPEHILNKPGRLTPSEFERMKSHARVGAEILSEIEFPYPVVPLVRHHHENWDGTGYPDGISGEAIPIGARILSVVDCFDALTSDRPYRRALPADEAMRIIEARSGSMYDPAIVAAFREVCAALPDPSVSSARAAAAAAHGCDTGEPPSARQGAEPVPPDLAAALRIGAAIGTAHGSRPVWRAVAGALREVLAVDDVVVFGWEDASGSIAAVCAVGRHADRLAGLAIPIGERMSGWSAANEQPMVNADATLDLFDRSAAELRSALVVPLASSAGRRLVVAMYDSRPDPFTAAHVDLVRETLTVAAALDATPAGAMVEAR